MSSHPVPKARWAALKDDAFWVPMKGIVSRTAEAFSIDPESAGGLIADGMAAGTIAHKPMTADQFWVVAPRGADLVRQSGFSYDTGLDWGEGRMIQSGAPPVPLAIYWPDVVKATGEAMLQTPRPSQKPTQTAIDTWMLAYCQAASNRGECPPKRDEAAFVDCRAATGATDQLMRAAWNKVPQHLKRMRGQTSAPNRAFKSGN